MDIKLVKSLRKAAISRPLLSQIELLYAKSATNTGSSATKGSYWFELPLTVYFDDDETGEGSHFTARLKFTPRLRGFFVFKLFEPKEESGLLKYRDPLKKYMEGRGDNLIHEHLNPVRAKQMKQAVVRFFDAPEKWEFARRYVYRDNDIGRIHILDLVESPDGEHL